MLLVTTPPASKPVASQFYFDVALRGVDAGTHRSPGGLAHLVGPQVPELPGFQRSDTRVADADTAAVRQLQAGVLACDQDGCSPVALHLFLAVEEVDGAALAAPGIPTDDRLETFEVESFGITVFVPVFFEGVEQVARARAEGVAFAPVGAQIVQVGGGDAASVAAEPQLETQSGMPIVEVAQVEPKITSSSVWAECTTTTSSMRSRWSRLRSMLMIGVIPLPALMNSIFAGSGSGRVNTPSTSPRRTMSPGSSLRTRYGETTPFSTSLGVTLMSRRPDRDRR